MDNCNNIEPVTKHNSKSFDKPFKEREQAEKFYGMRFKQKGGKNRYARRRSK